MTDKGRSGAHSAKPVKVSHDLGRCMHPNATMRNQAANKGNPAGTKGGKGK
jgi:hypothetical protein